MSPSTDAAFDFAHELSRGTTLLEASAGTGKTYALAAVALKLLLEVGLAVDELLLVTFTRAATAELRGRVRARLAAAARALAGQRPPREDDLRAIWTDDAAERALRLGRARSALEGFDTLSIATIHGFCQRVLARYAFASGADLGLELEPDRGELVERTSADLLVAELTTADEEFAHYLSIECGLEATSLRALGKAALADVDLPLDPPAGSLDGFRAAARARFEDLQRSLQGEGRRQVEELLSQAFAEGWLCDAGQDFNEELCRTALGELAEWLATTDPEAAWFAFLPANATLLDPGSLADQRPEGAPPLEHPFFEAFAGFLDARARCCGAVRAQWAARYRRVGSLDARRRRVQGYHDLLLGLCRRLEATADPVAREALVRAVGGQFRAALVDEFQDTDRYQWRIVSSLFGSPDHYLFLVGDPKQSIYRFRGADLHVYLRAQEESASRASLATNHRSDPAYLEAIEPLFRGEAPFGSPDVPFVPVRAHHPDPESRLLLPSSPSPDLPLAPLNLRFVDAKHTGGTPWLPLKQSKAVRCVCSLVADDVVRLLESGLRIAPRHGGSTAPPAPICPRDVAVLVRTNWQARLVLQALRRARVPGVLLAAESVFQTEAASELLLWLEALNAPRSDGAARRCAVTRAFGWNAEGLVALQRETPQGLAAWRAWLEALARSREAWRRHGLAHAFRVLARETFLHRRLLSQPEGERLVTDLFHAVELLDAHAVREGCGLRGLIEFLRLERTRSAGDLATDQRRLRLDRDDAAVRVLTAHVAKGLEFPIVFAPFLWYVPGGAKTKVLPPLVGPRDPEVCDPLHKVLDVFPPGSIPERRAREAWDGEEGFNEERRLFYVALTRARHAAYVYAGNFEGLQGSPLGCALEGDEAPPEPFSADDPSVSWPEGFDPEKAAALPEKDRGGALEGASAFVRWQALVEATNADKSPRMSLTRAPLPERKTWAPAAPGTSEDGEAAVRRFERTEFQRGWRRASFSSLKGEEHARFLEPEPEGRETELEEGTPADASEAAPSSGDEAEAQEVPLSGVPSSAELGTALHEVFERLDFAKLRPGGDAAELDETLRRVLPRHGFDPDEWSPRLRSGLSSAVRTPVGGPLGDWRLCDLRREDRMDELDFLLSVAGGRGHRGREQDPPLSMRRLAEALDARSGPRPYPADYPRRLARLGSADLAGFLGGSIDLVFRAEQGGETRYFLVDYKTNRLGSPERSTLADYAPEALAHVMAEHHYVLQYHLYALALHRWLRHRLGSAYEAGRHFGGVYYLFVRGLAGPDTPSAGEGRYGVYYDPLGASVLEALDRACAARVSTAGGRR